MGSGRTPLGEQKKQAEKVPCDCALARPCKRPLLTVTRTKALDKRITYPLVVSESRETQGVQYHMLQRVARSKALDG